MYIVLSMYIWPSAPTVAPSGLAGGGGDRNELIVTWTVSGGLRVVCVYVCETFVYSILYMAMHSIQQYRIIKKQFQCQDVPTSDLISLI